jgi:hypothetical protein
MCITPHAYGSSVRASFTTARLLTDTDSVAGKGKFNFPTGFSMLIPKLEIDELEQLSLSQIKTFEVLTHESNHKGTWNYCSHDYQILKSRGFQNVGRECASRKLIIQCVKLSV